MAMQVAITRGAFALVDDDDFDSVAGFAWYLDPCRQKQYARRAFFIDGRQTSQSMHRLILSPQIGQEVDHINGDGLDNRRSNLRIATRKQNCQNVYRPNPSGFKGVSLDRWTKTKNPCWRAKIQIDGRQIAIGRFASAEEAAVAYDRKAREAWGEFAFLNFPDDLNPRLISTPTPIVSADELIRRRRAS